LYEFFGEISFCKNVLRYGKLRDHFGTVSYEKNAVIICSLAAFDYEVFASGFLMFPSIN